MVNGMCRVLGKRATGLVLLIALSLAGVSASGANPFLRDTEPPASVLIIAHAGASSVAPQDTLAAGRAAFRLGADVWGVDVRLTADGAFILMHDETLDRTTDVEERFPGRSPWRVGEFTLDEIRALDAGSWFVREDPFGQIADGLVSAADLAAYAGEPVPTLCEALDFVAERRWLIDIEVKPSASDDPEELARRLLDLIAEMQTADYVMVSSFDHEVLRAIKRLDPAIPTGALGIFAPLDPVAYLDDLRADVYLPSLVGYTGGLLEALSEVGIRVHVWTYNTEDQLEHLAATPGITGIYTDFPQRLRAILDRLRPADDV